MLKILCVTPEVGAPFVINILQPLQTLKSRGEVTFTVVKEKDALIQDVMAHDLLLFFRNFSPRMLKLLHFSKLSGKPVIFSLDDNFFELASSEKGPMKDVELNAHSNYISNSDLVMVYSDLMVEKVRSLNKKVIKTVPGGIDFSALEGFKRRPCGEKIRIIYATSRYKNDILSQLFLPALKKIFMEYQGLVEMDLWGYMPKELEGVPGINRIEKMEYGKYLKRLYFEGFDIGLAPLKDDLFHRSKTNTKFRDYGACGIAGIYSNVDVYSDVENGKTGLLVENDDNAWYGAIKRLIEDKNLRESISKNAYRHVRNKYDLNATADNLYEALRKAIDNKGGKKTIAKAVNGIAAQFLEMRPPRILFMSPSGGDMPGELPGLMRLYRYPFKFVKTSSSSGLDAHRLERYVAAYDAVVRLGLDHEKASGLAPEASKRKVFSCHDGNIINVLNEIEKTYFSSVRYSFSLKPIWARSKSLRSLLSEVLFKKTKVNSLERYLRKSVRDPIRNFLRNI